jgi:hypothetical protein
MERPAIKLNVDRFSSISNSRRSFGNGLTRASWNLPGHIEERHKKPQLEQSVFGQRYEPSTSRGQIYKHINLLGNRREKFLTLPTVELRLLGFPGRSLSLYRLRDIKINSNHTQ